MGKCANDYDIIQITIGANSNPNPKTIIASLRVIIAASALPPKRETSDRVNGCRSFQRKRTRGARESEASPPTSEVPRTPAIPPPGSPGGAPSIRR
jgi:hypothetical protein